MLNETKKWRKASDLAYTLLTYIVNSRSVKSNNLFRYMTRKYLPLWVLALTLGLQSPAMAANAVPSNPADLTVAAESAVNSVVYIKVVTGGKTQTIQYSDPFFEDFFGDFFGNGNGQQRQRIQTPKRVGAGSGVILTEDGYIVTNNHVVENAEEMTVKLNDNREFKARIIGTDKSTDLALIKIEAKGLQAIKVGNSDNLKLGEWVLAIGNPFSLTSTVTAGIVSAKARSLNATPGSIDSYIQTDAAINPGNSGGALVNTKGELVGINAMLYSQTGSFSGYGFAIPTSIMNKVVDDLKTYGTVQRAVVGIQGSDVKNYVDGQKEQGKDIDLGTMEGIYVAKVTEESAAEEAGLKEGDVIIAIDGKEMNKMADMQEYLAKKRPGDKVTVTYLRDKKKNTKSITLKNEQGNTQVVKKADLDVLGGNFRSITDAQKQQLNIGYGLEVLKVNSGKLKNAGITKGFIIQRVNDNAVKTIEDLQNIVKDASTSKDPVLYIQGVYPTGKKAYFAVPLED